MRIRSLLGASAVGLAGIATTTSCVPVRAVARAEAVRPIRGEEAQLLRRLALTPPAPATGALPADAPAIVTPLTGAPAFTPAARSDSDAERAVRCLTDAVYYEARSEPLDGQRAVAQVVLNRVRDRAFPASVCGVVYQRTATVCQFSFACDGSMLRPRDPAAWARAAMVARAAYGGEVFAPVGASTHFHTAAIHPWWAPSLARVGQIGAHVFYGWRRAMLGALTFRQAYGGVEPGAPAFAAATIADAAGEPTMGVTIHRGNRPDPAAAVAAAVAGPTPAAPRLVYTAGVTIHRKASLPEQGSHGATIGPEEAPADSL